MELTPNSEVLHLLQRAAALLSQTGRPLSSNLGAVENPARVGGGNTGQRSQELGNLINEGRPSISLSQG